MVLTIGILCSILAYHTSIQVVIVTLLSKMSGQGTEVLFRIWLSRDYTCLVINIANNLWLDVNDRVIRLTVISGTSK
jgi:hypothetical protein